MKESSYNNIPFVSNKEKSNNFNLSKVLIEFLWEEPFYSRILRSLNKIETDEIPTAAVSIQNYELNLWWNNDFFSSLTLKQVKGVLKHECMHLVYNHVTSRKKEPNIVWNYATDLAINSLICYDELPEGCLYPGHSLPELNHEQLANYNFKEITAYKNLSEQIKNFPKNKSAEYYFDELIKEQFVNELSKGMSDNIIFDFHDKWDELSDDEKDLFSNKINEIVKDAINEANEKNWGSISSETRKNICSNFSNTIDWKTILKKFCGINRKAERKSSVKRLNRKYPGVHSGFSKDYKPLIGVYIDESGSITEEDLNSIFGELSNLSKTTDFIVYKFDHAVDEKSSFIWKKGKNYNHVRNLNGGTNFNAPTKHAMKNKNKLDGYLILTDGCAIKPIASTGIKRGYVLLPKTSLRFEKDQNDVLIEMK